MPGDHRDERGSALLLVPAGILIVILLGAIVVDTAVVFLAEREAEAAAAAAANDLATLALDEELLRRTGEYEIDPTTLPTLESVIGQTVRERLSKAFVEGTVTVSVRVVSSTQVEVRVSGEARRVVGPMGWTGVGATRSVSAAAVGLVTVEA